MSDNDWQERQRANSLGRDGSSAESGWDNWTREEYERGRREAEYYRSHGSSPTSTQPVSSSSSSSGDGALGILFLLIPPLYLPGLAVVKTWLFLPPAWHPLLKILVCGAEIAIFFYLLKLFYRHSPQIVCALITAAYLAGAYGLAAHLGFFFDWKPDPMWLGGIIVGTGLLGYFLGRKLSSWGKDD